MPDILFCKKTNMLEGWFWPSTGQERNREGNVLFSFRIVANVVGVIPFLLFVHVAILILKDEMRQGEQHFVQSILSFLSLTLYDWSSSLSFSLWLSSSLSSSWMAKWNRGKNTIFSIENFPLCCFLCLFDPLPFLCQCCCPCTHPGFYPVRSNKGKVQKKNGKKTNKC